MKIREYKQEDLRGIRRVIRTLHPDWFTKEALKNIPLDIQFQKCFVAEDENKVVGFISVYCKDGHAELDWIGVDKKRQRKGIGTKLVKRVENAVLGAGLDSLFVETVGYCKPVYEPYAKTVRFYKEMGFKVHKKGKMLFEDGYEHKMYVFRKKLEKK